MANISIYSRTTKHRTSDFLILIHTRDKSQPRLLQVNLTYIINKLDSHDAAAHLTGLKVFSITVIHADDSDFVTFLYNRPSLFIQYFKTCCNHFREGSFSPIGRSISVGESLIAKDTSVVETPGAFAKSLMVTLGLFTAVRYVSANY